MVILLFELSAPTCWELGAGTEADPSRKQLRLHTRPAHPRREWRPRVIPQERVGGRPRFVSSTERAEHDDAFGVALFDEHAAGERRRVLVEELERAGGVAPLERGVCAREKPRLGSQRPGSRARRPGRYAVLPRQGMKGAVGSARRSWDGDFGGRR